MIFWGSILIILTISIILVVRSVEHELSVPKEVADLKTRNNAPLSGVILFLKKKIVHYTSSKSP